MKKPVGALSAFLGLLMLVGACGGESSIGPPEDPDGPVTRAFVNALVQGDTAPSLTTLQETFVAVAGERQTFEIRYDVDPIGEDDSNGRFFRLDLKQSTLLALADGTPLVEGDTVLITVTVDPVNIRVQLEPSGLQFDPAEPAELRFWYTLANPDLNGDGVVNSLDDDILNDLLALWMRPGGENSGEDWERLDASIHDVSDKRLRADLEHFSGYVVAW